MLYSHAGGDKWIWPDLARQGRGLVGCVEPRFAHTMPLWEYKHITSGPHGFATPALLESYLNQLGKDEWEIINFQPLPANPLAFNGIARRTTLRDWTLESAAAAAAKIEAEKLRAEFAAKFQGNAPAADSAAEKPASLIADTAAPEDGLRKLRDTTRDDDPDAPEEGEDWDNWDNLDDDLPTLFEAIKPHLRKNQRGPGQAVGITFLAKRWEQTEADLVAALKECGLVPPESEDTPPEYLEFEGDLYWLNLNNRHELFLNTREKPRPVFRIAAAKKIDPADPVNALLAEEAAAEQAEKSRRDAERIAREAEHAARRAEREAQRAAQQATAAAPAVPAASADAETPSGGSQRPEIPAGPLPQGEELLAAIRPQMRRNRRGPGYSGSTTYLSRAFKCTEADLVTALAAVGLNVPETAAETPVPTVIGAHIYWLNKDSRGGIWINGDEAVAQKPEGETPPTGETAPVVTAQPPVQAEAFPFEKSASTPASAPAPSAESQNRKSETASPIAAVRLLLKPNKKGSGFSGEMGFLARTLEKDHQEFLTVLTGLGLALPATEDDKPAFVEHGGEVFWLNKNAKDGSVWLNAKASKSSAKKTVGGAVKAKAKKTPKAE